MSAELELCQEPNPNLVTFEEHYHRRLRLPVRFNFEVQTKLAMFRRLAQNMPPLPEGYGLLVRLMLSRERERCRARSQDTRIMPRKLQGLEKQSVPTFRLPAASVAGGRKTATGGRAK